MRSFAFCHFPRARRASVFNLLVATLAVDAAQRTWDGGGSDYDWRTAQNWDGGITRPVPIEAGDTLVFPEGPAKLLNTNDFGAGTNFNSLTFSGDDYIVWGSRIGLSNGISVTHASGATALHLPITLREDQSFSVSSASAFLHLYADISIGLNTLTFDGAGSSVLIGEITNPRIGGRGSVVKIGTGRLTIFQPTEHDATTVVNGGTLAVESRMTNSVVRVNAGGTLRGSGRIGGLDGSGGVVQPGGTNPDTLECFGDAAFAASTVLRLRLNGTTAGVDYDQLEVHGTVTLGGTLEIVPGFLPAVGDRFTIIDNDGVDDVVGSFAGLPEGAEFTLNGRPFKISYGDRFGGFGRDVNDVTIEAIPALAVWDAGGGLNRSWSEPRNWVGDTLPYPGDDIHLVTTSSSTMITSNDFPAGMVFGSLSFSGGPHHRLDGNLIELNGDIYLDTVQANINAPLALPRGLTLRNQPDRGSLFVGAQIRLLANQTLSFPNGRFYCAGEVLTDGYDLTVNNAGKVEFQSFIGAGEITKNGLGELSLEGPATPAFVIDEGMVTLVSEGFLGGETTVNAGGVLNVWQGEVTTVDVRNGGVLDVRAATASGRVRMLSGSTFRTHFYRLSSSAPSTNSVLLVSSNLSVTGCSVEFIVDSGASPPNDSFSFIRTFRPGPNQERGEVIGTFPGLPDGAVLSFPGSSRSFEVIYTENGVSLRRIFAFTWVGSTNGYWSVPANWLPVHAPIGGTDLIFPADAAQLVMTNDLPGRSFDAITIQRPSYVVRGNAFAVNEIHCAYAAGDTIVEAGVSGIADVSITNLSVAINPETRLIMDGVVQAFVTKRGAGTLRLGGGADNSAALRLEEGTVELSKTNGNAISSFAQIGGGFTPVTVRLLNDHQIGDDARIGVLGSGRLDLNGNSDGIGELIGDGFIELGERVGRFARLVVREGAFQGLIEGRGGLTKTGLGLLTLSGSNTFSGTTILAGGTLEVQGIQTNSDVIINSGILGGQGRVGALRANSSALVAPGRGGAGLHNALHSGDVELNLSTTFQPMLTHTDPGFEARHLKVAGSVILGNSVLDVRRLGSFAPPTNQAVIIIENDGVDPVSGTFAQLPEGTLFTASGISLKISYVGGSGNDVTVTRISTPATTLSSITALGVGRLQIAGAGLADIEYIVQAASNLNPVISWTQVGRATGDSSGIFQFIHSNAPSMNKRFYRAVSP